MKKKIMIPLICVVVIAAAVGGVFYWRENVRLTPVEEWNKAKYSEPSDFTVTETAEQKIIENKSAGLTFAIPKDWTATSTESFFELESPEAKEKSPSFMENGCRIIVEIGNIKANIATLEEQLKNSIWAKHVTEQKIEKIDGKDAFIFVAKSENSNFYHSGTVALNNGKIYSLTLDTTLEDANKCSQDFQTVLNSVKIQ